MKPPVRTLAVAVALVIATTAAAAAATSPSATEDPHGQLAQRKALYQSELERNLQQRTQAGDEAVVGERLTGQHRALYLAELVRNRRQRTQADNEAAVGHRLVAQRKALYQSELDTTLARHRALGALAAQPDPGTRPAVPGPGVDVLATLLVGLVGGLVGGALVVISVVVTRPGRLRVRGAA